MQSVGIHEAKTNLSKLLAKVVTGQEVVIAKGGVPIAKIVPIDHPPKDRAPGRDADKAFFIADDFDAPLPTQILAAFNK